MSEPRDDNSADVAATAADPIGAMAVDAAVAG